MSAALDSTLQDATDLYLRQLRAGDFDSAFHGLIDLDPAVVHLLIAAYHAETSASICASLLRIISEFRTPSALPLLAEALRCRRDDQWKQALDGLVRLASVEAIQTLEAVIRDEAVAPNPESSYIDWVREALDQTKQAHGNNSNSTGNASYGGDRPTILAARQGRR